MSFLDFREKNILVFGVANKRSIAHHTAKMLEEEGANVFYSVHTAERRDSLVKLLPNREIVVCDISKEDDIKNLAAALPLKQGELHGLLHSVAFANYEGAGEGLKPFHETRKGDFLQAVDVSCFSLIAVCNALKDKLHRQASVVAVSISTTRMAAENYGFMAPAKAALDSSLAFLAKSFSAFSEIRFNAVAASLLKTSSSAGIPGYLDSYLFAEQVIPRKRALQTEEVAAAAVFLLSAKSSGFNAQNLVLDAGMSVNYFDRAIVEKITRPGDNK